MSVQRIEVLIDDGYIGSILISHDVCVEAQLRTYGGCGYDYTLRMVVRVAHCNTDVCLILSLCL